MKKPYVIPVAEALELAAPTVLVGWSNGSGSLTLDDTGGWVNPTPSAFPDDFEILSFLNPGMPIL